MLDGDNSQCWFPQNRTYHTVSRPDFLFSAWAGGHLSHRFPCSYVLAPHISNNAQSKKALCDSILSTDLAFCYPFGTCAFAALPQPPPQQAPSSGPVGMDIGRKPPRAHTHTLLSHGFRLNQYISVVSSPAAQHKCQIAALRLAHRMSLLPNGAFVLQDASDILRCSGKWWC